MSAHRLAGLEGTYAVVLTAGRTGKRSRPPGANIVARDRCLLVVARVAASRRGRINDGFAGCSGRSTPSRIRTGDLLRERLARQPPPQPRTEGLHERQSIQSKRHSRSSGELGIKGGLDLTRLERSW